MRFPSLRVTMSAGMVATLLSLLSVVTVLAGDGNAPFPK